jgi:tetratricopeptide (TPR) repeat protein
MSVVAAHSDDRRSAEPASSTLGASGSPLLAATDVPPAAELDLGGRTRMANLRAAMFGVPVEPARVDRFVLLETLGAGGMGVVHAAYDPRLDRRVALKLVHTEVAAASAGGDGRLVREAQAMARLSHPNVVQIHEVGAWEGRIFIAMELVAGRTLAAWLAAGRRSWREVVAVFVEAGLVHRDFKPDNVLIGDDGRVRVTDFGLARGGVDGATERDARHGPGDPLAALAGASHTLPGSRAGTPAYMSPEQFLGEVATAASDQFSFCVALHHGLHGVHPFPGDDRVALANAVIAGQRREPPRVLSPRKIHRAVVRGLAREPAARFSGMDALLAAIAPRPRLHVVAPALALALLGGGSLAVAASGGEAPCADAGPLLAGSWDPPARDGLRGAFAGAAIADAAVLGASTEEGLDGYAAEVSRVYVQSCRAERSGESSAELHDLRVTCLRRRLAVVRGVIDRVASGEPAALREAPEAAAKLRDLGVCEEEGGVLLGMSPPPPGQAEALARVRGRIDEARALELVGDLAGSGAAIDEALPEARALGHEPTLAEALGQRGRLDVLARDSAAADAALREALELAVRSRLDALIPEIAVWGVQQVALGGEGTIVLARERLGLADAWTRRGGATPSMRAALALAEGSVHDLAGDYEAAAAASGRAVAIAVEALGEDHLTVAVARGNHATHLAAAGHTAAALVEHRAVLTMVARKVGGVHALVADAHYNLASTLMDDGSHAALTEAEGHLEKSGPIFAALAEVPSVDLADNHIALARVAYLRDDLETAERRAAEGLAIFDRHHPDHPARAYALSFRAAVATERGRLTAALELHQTARALFARTNGEVSVVVASTDRNIAGVLHAQKDLAGARQYYEAAIRTYEAVQGPETVYLRDSLVGLAEVQLAEGEACAARDGLARATALGPTDPPAEFAKRAAAACEAVKPP